MECTTKNCSGFREVAAGQWGCWYRRLKKATGDPSSIDLESEARYSKQAEDYSRQRGLREGVFEPQQVQDISWLQTTITLKHIFQDRFARKNEGRKRKRRRKK